MTYHPLGSPRPLYTSLSAPTLGASTRYLPDSPLWPYYPSVTSIRTDRPQERRLPILTSEIFDRILSHADTATLRTCSLLSSLAGPMAQTYLVESVTFDYNSEYQCTHDATTKLQALFSKFPGLSQYVKHLVIKDTPASFERLYSQHLMYMDEDEKAEHDDMVRKHNALCPGLMYDDDALAGILERTTDLLSLEIDLRQYQLDWEKYENWHSMKDVTSVLGLATLTAITLRGITGIPFSVLEKARNLKSLSISRSSVCFDDVLPVSPLVPYAYLESLRTKDIAGGADLARYFGAWDVVIRVHRLRTIYVEMARQEDVEVARAVLEYATELEDLQMSTMFYFQKNMHATTPLNMNTLSFTNLRHLKKLSVRLDFRDGVTHELDWFPRAMSTFPVNNALETVLVIIDAGFVHTVPKGKGRCERTDLQKYGGWHLWEEVFLGPAFGRLARLTILINTGRREDCELGYGCCLLPQECIRLERLTRKWGQRLVLVETCQEPDEVVSARM